MKTKVCLRVAYDKRNRNKVKVEANVRPNNRPLSDGYGEALPTVAFSLMLDIPDALFSQAEQVIAELRIPEEAASIAAEVTER